MNASLILSAVVVGLALAGCGSTPPAKQASTPPKSGGYYLVDGPAANPPPNLDAVPDAVPRQELLHRFANRTYVALGNSYTPQTERRAHSEEGLASWYGRRFHGKKTASGELYDMYAMTAAHPTLPIPSYARVTALDSGKSVVVRINDRGPFHSKRVIDLSYTSSTRSRATSQAHRSQNALPRQPGTSSRARRTGSRSLRVRQTPSLISSDDSPHSRKWRNSSSPRR